MQRCQPRVSQPLPTYNSNLSVTYDQAHPHNGLTPHRDSHAGTARSRAIHNRNTLQRGTIGRTRTRRDAKEPPPFSPFTQRARPGLLQAGGGAERYRAITGATVSHPLPPPAATHRLIPQRCGLTAQVSRGGATGGRGQPPPRGKGFSSRRAVGDNRHCRRGSTFGHGDRQETAACPRGLPRKEGARTQRSVSIWACSRSRPAGGGGEAAAGERSAGLGGGSAICAVTAGGRQGRATGRGWHPGGCIAAPPPPRGRVIRSNDRMARGDEREDSWGRASTTPWWGGAHYLPGWPPSSRSLSAAV